VCLTFTFEVFE